MKVCIPVLTCGELFCGGGGWIANLLDILTPLWAIDNDPKVVSAYRRNYGDHVICADVTAIDPRNLMPVDILFASPPCQQWSNIRSNQSQTRCDAEVGTVICRYIEVLQPKFVFIENVRGYAKSKSIQAIIDKLYSLGYWFDVATTDAADFGVPQHRERLILRAVRYYACFPLATTITSYWLVQCDCRLDTNFFTIEFDTKTAIAVIAVRNRVNTFDRKGGS